MEVVGLDQDYGLAELEDAGSPGLRYSHYSVDGQTWIMALLCKNRKKGVGESFARGRSDA